MSSCALLMSGAKVQSLKEILRHHGKKHSICGLLLLLPSQCVKYSPSNDVHRSSLLELGVYINHTIGCDECIGVMSETLASLFATGLTQGKCMVILLRAPIVICTK
jgi:hypothetical protein